MSDNKMCSAATADRYEEDLTKLRTELESLTEDKRILSGQLFDCRKERKMALDRELSVRTSLASQAAKIEAQEKELADLRATSQSSASKSKQEATS